MATHQQDQLRVVNPTDQPFTVRWAGNPYTLLGRQEMIWPRFLAEHFAKHLTDSILLKREQEVKLEYQRSGKPMSEYIAPALLNSRQERPKVVNTIILGVYNYYTPQNGPADAIQQQIAQWNQNQQPQAQQEKVADMGNAVDPLMGVLNDDDQETLPPVAPAPPIAPPTMAQVQGVIGAAPAPPLPQATVPPAPIAPAAPVAPVQPTQPVQPPQPTTPSAPAETAQQKRGRLLREAKQLGIKLNPSISTEELEQTIKKQYA